MATILKRIYLDTNCLLDLIHCRNGVTFADARLVGKMVNKGRISILTSIFNLEELLPKICAEPVQFGCEIRFLLQLADRTCFIKPPNELVRQAILAVLAGQCEISPFMEMHEMWPGIELMLDPDPYNVTELLGLSSQISPGIERFKNLINGLGDEFIIRHKEECGYDPRSNPPPLADLWDTMASILVRGLVERSGLPISVKDSDISNLLDNRCILLTVGDLVVRSYSCMFLKHRSRPGDSRDNLHAVSASACDVFLTNDDRFRQYIMQIPSLPIQVTSLQAFLSDMR